MVVAVADDAERSDPTDPFGAFLGHLRALSQQMVGLGLPTGAADPGAGAPSSPDATAMTAWAAAMSAPIPWPGALTEAQVSAVHKAVSAQRASVAALRSQLDAFDSQLKVLDDLLGPMSEWSRRWAQTEAALNPRSRPPDDQPAAEPT